MSKNGLLSFLIEYRILITKQLIEYNLSDTQCTGQKTNSGALDLAVPGEFVCEGI